MHKIHVHRLTIVSSITNELCIGHLTQRHETIGTRRVYSYFENQAVSISVNAHDRNLSINKFICESTTATSQNNLWHALNTSPKSKNKFNIVVALSHVSDIKLIRTDTTL